MMDSRFLEGGKAGTRFLPPDFSEAHATEKIFACWRRLAKETNANFSLEQAGAERVPVFRSAAFSRGNKPCFYASAGIHGDEIGAVWGLLEFVAGLGALAKEIPMLLFPVFNPWGVRENSRRDASGTDLNRIWHDAGHPLRVLVEREMRGRQFSFFANLHEDYDAGGVYLYEPSVQTGGIGEEILRHLEIETALDTRKKIEGLPVTQKGLVRRKKIPPKLLAAMPESLFLREMGGGNARVFTFETPSERDLKERVRVQVYFLNVLLKFFLVSNQD